MNRLKIPRQKMTEKEYWNDKVIVFLINLSQRKARKSNISLKLAEFKALLWLTDSLKIEAHNINQWEVKTCKKALRLMLPYYIL